MKPFALLASRIRKAILVDADVVFPHRPDSIFESHPKLHETRTLFGHDRAGPRNGDYGRWLRSANDLVVPENWRANEHFYHV